MWTLWDSLPYVANLSTFRDRLFAGYTSSKKVHLLHVVFLPTVLNEIHHCIVICILVDVICVALHTTDVGHQGVKKGAHHTPLWRACAQCDCVWPVVPSLYKLRQWSNWTDLIKLDTGLEAIKSKSKCSGVFRSREPSLLIRWWRIIVLNAELKSTKLKTPVFQVFSILDGPVLAVCK